jgi:cytochrome c biogenesis protein CcmG/thiol:disulfide interchange protein DsbE
MLLRRILFILPPLIFLVMLGIFGWQLLQDKDPRDLPSALLQKPAPGFDLPPVPGASTPGFSDADLKDGGIKLVNVFASWCVPCRAEHEVITKLAKEYGLPVYGINWKDKAPDASAWLSDLGNPFTAVGYDHDGRVGIDWGVGGVPESYIVDGQGVIRFKQSGPIYPKDIEEKILPVLKELKG